MLKRAISILPLLAGLLVNFAAGQQASVSSVQTPTSKNISFAWADSEGVHLGSPKSADDWVRKNSKNFPTIRFSQTPVSGTESYLIVFSASESVLSGFKPVQKSESTTTSADISGDGIAIDNRGSMWLYTYSGSATTTTTTMTQENVPYTIDLRTLYVSVYDGRRSSLISRHSETIGRQQGGDADSKLVYNLGQLAHRIRLKTRLLNAAVGDVVRFQ